MIIFDLDGTLADCEHRKHLVTPPSDTKLILKDSIPHGNGCILTGDYEYKDGSIWNPDWQAFHEACDKDNPINEAINVYNQNLVSEYHWNKLRGTIPIPHFSGINQIWTGRSESVRAKTEKWLETNLLNFESNQLKMRPIGDCTPDDVLKERWLDEALAEGKEIEFVFDNSERCCTMWRRRGIFVFNCAQNDVEY